MRGKAYSIDLREKVIQAVDNKKYTIQEIAGMFKVSRRWIYKLIYQRRNTGSIAPIGHGGGREAKFQGESLKELKKLVNSQPDITLQEILDQTGVDASIMAVHRALKRLDFRRKKNHFGHQNRIAQT
jgi:transposase